MNSCLATYQSKAHWVSYDNINVLYQLHMTLASYATIHATQYSTPREHRGHCVNDLVYIYTVHFFESLSHHRTL